MALERVIGPDRPLLNGSALCRLATIPETVDMHTLNRIRVLLLLPTATSEEAHGVHALIRPLLGLGGVWRVVVDDLVDVFPMGAVPLAAAAELELAADVGDAPGEVQGDTFGDDLRAVGDAEKVGVTVVAGVGVGVACVW